MNKLVAAIKKIAVEMILNDDTKEKVIKQLNKKMNLPMISEETEAELLDALYEAMQEALQDAIEKKQLPKQIYNESDFSGGINGLDSPRDVAETQVIEGKSIAFDEKGRIRMLGRAVKTEIGNIVSDNITDPGFDAGTSFFRFGYDYGMLDDSDDDIFDTSPDAGETGFLVLGNRQHIAIWDSSSATGHWFTVAIDTGDDPTAGSRKMQFYFLNGALRAYNPTFFANSKPTWHGHVKRKLFGDANKDYSEWYTTYECPDEEVGF